MTYQFTNPIADYYDRLSNQLAVTINTFDLIANGVEGDAEALFEQHLGKGEINAIRKSHEPIDAINDLRDTKLPGMLKNTASCQLELITAAARMHGFCDAVTAQLGHHAVAPVNFKRNIADNALIIRHLYNWLKETSNIPQDIDPRLKNPGAFAEKERQQSRADYLKTLPSQVGYGHLRDECLRNVSSACLTFVDAALETTLFSMAAHRAIIDTDARFLHSNDHLQFCYMTDGQIKSLAQKLSEAISVYPEIIRLPKKKEPNVPWGTHRLVSYYP